MLDQYFGIRTLTVASAYAVEPSVQLELDIPKLGLLVCPLLFFEYQCALSSGSFPLSVLRGQSRNWTGKVFGQIVPALSGSSTKVDSGS